MMMAHQLCALSLQLEGLVEEVVVYLVLVVFAHFAFEVVCQSLVLE